jgi:hypothetical protein
LTASASCLPLRFVPISARLRCFSPVRLVLRQEENLHSIGRSIRQPSTHQAALQKRLEFVELPRALSRLATEQGKGGMQLLLITGPAGVGKSTLSWEMSAQLAAAKVAHAVIETDELDRVFPHPRVEELDRIQPGTTDVSSINLAATWSTYRALGHTRLIMSGVMMHLDFDKRWILAVIPEAQITVVRMLATEPTLLARLAQREIGSGSDEQAQRSLRQARRMAGGNVEGMIVLPTDGKRPAELAKFILQKTGWLEAGQDQGG